MGTKHNKIQWTVALGAAGAWFGQHCGAGFASGLQEISFFVNAGWLSLLTTLVPMVIIGVSFYFIGEFARQIKARSYKDVALALFPGNKVAGRVALILFDLVVLSSVIVTSSTTIAGAGTLLNQTLGMDYLLATIVFSATIVVISMFGARFLAKFNLPLSIALVGSLLVIVVAIFSTNADNLVTIVTRRETFGTSAGDAIKNMLLYTGMQTGFTSAYIAIAGQFGCKEDNKVMAIAGIVINTVMLFLVSAAVLSGMPGIASEDIPILALVQQHFGSSSPLFGFYSLSLFLAYVSTADIVAATSRFGVLFNPSGGRNQVIIDAILGIILLAGSLVLAQLGIRTLVDQGYKILGAFRGPVYLAAGLIFSPIAIRRLRRVGVSAPLGSPAIRFERPVPGAVERDAVTALGIAIADGKAAEASSFAGTSDTLTSGRQAAAGERGSGVLRDAEPTASCSSQLPVGEADAHVSATKLGSRALEDEFVQIVRSLDGDLASRAQGDAYLAGTHALYHGEPTPWALTPKIFDASTVELLRTAAQTMGTIMDKLTRAFRTNAAIRSQFALDPALERLCCLDTGYEQQIPLARVDIFLNEETGAYQFCELNTDGSAGMVTSDEVTKAVRLTSSFQEFERRHPGLVAIDTCNAWVDALLETYQSWQGPLCSRGDSQEKPIHGDTPMSLAIVDFSQSIDEEDVEHFVALFGERGVQAHFTDVGDLRIEEDESGAARLVDNDGPIECVWHRAVTGELWSKPCEGRDALARAAEQNIACIIGGFRTWPCATKTVFAVLWSEAATEILTPDELEFVHEHVPYTEVLTPESDLSRFFEKDAWIVKPSGGYNSVGVLAGLDATDDEWRAALAKTAHSEGIVQRYAQQYRTPCLRGTLVEGERRGEPSEADELGFADAVNMEGLFLFNGKFTGVYARCGFANTIGEWTSRLNMGCFYEL